MSKEEAILFLLKILKTPMLMASKATREKAFEIASEHKISAVDLLSEFQKMVWNI